MRMLLSLTALALALTLPAQAQQQSKFKRCLQPDEVVAEQLLHHGVFLRESGRRCNDMKPGTEKLWNDFEQKFMDKLKKQVDKHAKLFKREFKDDALKVITYFDGRLVTYHRHYPLSTVYCENVSRMLNDVTKSGWKAFDKQAKIVQNEIWTDYKACQ